MRSTLVPQARGAAPLVSSGIKGAVVAMSAATRRRRSVAPSSSPSAAILHPGLGMMATGVDARPSAAPSRRRLAVAASSAAASSTAAAATAAASSGSGSSSAAAAPPAPTPIELIYQRLQNGSDIRGVAIAGVEGQPLTLSPAVAFFIGKGLVEFLWRKKERARGSGSGGEASPAPFSPRIAVGRDPRLSGPMLEGALAAGVAAAGGQVARCGLATTPAMFLACVAEGYEFDGGVMITASHLPFNRNGFKFFTAEGGFEKGDIKEVLALAARAHAEAASEEEEEKEVPGAAAAKNIPRKKVLTPDAKALAVASSDPAAPPPDGTGFVLEAALDLDRHAVAEVDFMPVYEAHLRRIVVEGVDAKGERRERPLSGLHIVVDAGNGSGGFLATRVLAPLGADVSGSQFLEPDGTFPNHSPNPEDKAAMRAAVAMVRAARADLGIVVDTDVDRSAVVGASGEPINSNRYIALMAHIVLQKYPGTSVVTDSVTSDGLAEFIEARGGKHVRYRRGYRNVINKCVEINNDPSNGDRCELAMETSGHGAMAENYFLDDGTYSASQIVIMLARAVLAEEEEEAEEKKGKGQASPTAAATAAPKGGEKPKRKKKSSARDIAHSVLHSLKEPADSVEIRMQVLGSSPAEISATSQRTLQAFKDWIEGGGAGPSWSLEEVNHEGWRARVDESSGDGCDSASGGSGRIKGTRGWVLLRGSLHDPLLVLNAESSLANGSCAIVEKVLEFFEKVAPAGAVDIDKLYDSASPCTLRL